MFMDKISECEKLMNILMSEHKLPRYGYLFLLDNFNDDLALYAAEKAVCLRKKFYGSDVYVRGLIEFSNYCKNDCLYCGIRRSNHRLERYRLSREQILSCCEKGYGLGFRTFVLQSGEDPYFTDELLCSVVSGIKAEFPDCAVTLSVGEKSKDSYRAYYDAGADRYLLRHETADECHYKKLHPRSMSFENRMRCLNDLKKIGYQVGCGFMVGSPYQTNENLADDLKFIEEFRPHMCGIGPFIPHHDTPFASERPGSASFTCYLLSLIRLICPDILLPATTALGTAESGGREKGILAGANVVMPNLSPDFAKDNYSLYDNKLRTGAEDAAEVSLLCENMAKIGYNVVFTRGDHVFRCAQMKNE